MEWELSKENVQPLKTGRNVDVLNDALKAKAEGPTRSSIFEQQRRQLLEAIESYVGNDPLQPWIRCIKWFNDAFPAGGAQSELMQLLERCTRKFQKEECYRRDVRYLRVWVQYIRATAVRLIMTSPSRSNVLPWFGDYPSDVFAFLEANDIGQDHALFYEAYATSMEVRRNFSKSADIYQLGLNRSAQPLGRLENMYRSFLNRMHRRSERKIREEQQLLADGFVENNENDVQPRAFGPNTNAGDTLGQQVRRQRVRQMPLPTPYPRTSRQETAKMPIFVDPEFGGLPKVTTTQGEMSGNDPLLSSSAAWSHLATDSDKKKENVQNPIKWSDTKIKQKAHSQHGCQPSLNVFVDEEFAEVGNQKPVINSSKIAAPTLRLRLEDMQKSIRHSPGLRGSFLDVPDVSPPTAIVDTVKCQSETSKGGPTQGVASRRSPVEPVFGCDMSLLSENGKERCFEEFRFSTWNEKQQMYMKDQENHLKHVRSPDKVKRGRESAPSSMSEKVDMPGEPRSSAEIDNVVRRVDHGIINIPEAASGQRMVNCDDDRFSSREGPVVQCSSVQGDDNFLARSGGLRFGNHLVTEPAVSNSEDLRDAQLQPHTENISTASTEQPAIVHVNPSTSFTTQGDETVAIKRFADEVIVLGADSKINSIEVASHHGLVEPTINTKEALADILDMFNKPLECDNARPNARVPKDQKRRSSQSLVNSSSFQIFVDDDLDVQNSVRPKQDEKRAKASFDRCVAGSGVRTSGFHVFADENSDMQRRTDASKNGGMAKAAPLKPSVDLVSKSSDFHIFEDEDLNMLSSGNLEPDQTKAKKLIKESSADPGDQSGGFLIFKDENLGVQGAKDKIDKATPLTSRVLNTISESNAFSILVDEDLIVERPVKLGKIDEAMEEPAVSSPVHLGLHVDEYLRELSLDSDRLDDKSNKDKPNQKAAAESEETASASEINFLEVKVADETCSAASDQEAQEEHVSSTKNPEMDPMTITVNPWDESKLQDLLLTLKPCLSNFEGFLESSKKYSGSIPISSLKSSNVRNKILELGSSTYRLKRCIGQGAFAQVFEAEDEDDDVFDDAPTLALKFQRPGCPWEFYIYRQLDMRISNSNGDRSYYGSVRRFHLYPDCIFMVCNYGGNGTLQDVINAYLAAGQRMDEVLCMFYTIEMLRMLEILHGAGIIHGDFKPDNLLIRDDNGDLEAWAPDRPGCWKSQGLSLIDWGRSIDVTLYRKGTQFIGDSKTDSFRCPEMLENRPWTLQVDTFGLCGVVHCLIHGNYMQVEKIKAADAKTIYKPRAPYRRYWNVELWRGFFETLLNVNNSSDNLTLSTLRHAFEAYLTANSLGKKVKALLAKQRIMMFTRH